jgi:hypothetical protein
MLSMVKSTGNPRPAELDGNDIKELEAVCVFGIDNNKCSIKKFQKGHGPRESLEGFQGQCFSR